MFLLPMSDRDLIVTDVTPRTVDVASRAMNGRLSSLRVVKHVLISPSFTTVGSIPLSLLLLALTVGTPENGTKYYSDVIMGTVASQVTSLASVYSTVHSSVDQRKHQSSATLAFVWGIHRWPVNSPHKWPVTRKMFPFDDVIMKHWMKYSVHPEPPQKSKHPLKRQNSWVRSLPPQFLRGFWVKRIWNKNVYPVIIWTYFERRFVFISYSGLTWVWLPGAPFL